MDRFRDWLRRHASDPQVATLFVVLIVLVILVAVLGGFLAPVIASVVVAYVLDGGVQGLRRLRVPRLTAVVAVFLFFLTALLGFFLVLLPLLAGQVLELAQALPGIAAAVREHLLRLPQFYPELIGEQQAVELVDTIRLELLAIGQPAVAYALALLPTLVNLAIYLVLVPMLVFFFLKDKDRILGWLVGLLPADRGLAAVVWRDVDTMVGGYVRGKLYEIVIVAFVSYVTFALLGLDFSVLLATGTGLSVLIPYLGALVMVAPVGLVAFFQWGVSEQFLWVLLAYGFIQLLDGNVLAPLLLAETVKLHPIVVIISILVFGGIWGFWGVFFAVPLASVVQAVVNAWPPRQPG